MEVERWYIYIYRQRDDRSVERMKSLEKRREDKKQIDKEDKIEREK